MSEREISFLVMWHHVLGWTFGITLPTYLFALRLSIDPPNLTHLRAPIGNESKIKHSVIVRSTMGLPFQILMMVGLVVGFFLQHPIHPIQLMKESKFGRDLLVSTRSSSSDPKAVFVSCKWFSGKYLFSGNAIFRKGKYF